MAAANGVGWKTIAVGVGVAGAASLVLAIATSSSSSASFQTQWTSPRTVAAVATVAIAAAVFASRASSPGAFEASAAADEVDEGERETSDGTEEVAQKRDDPAEDPTQQTTALMAKWREAANTVSLITEKLVLQLHSDTDLRLGNQTHPFALNIALLDTLRKRRSQATEGKTQQGAASTRDSERLLSDAERYLRLAASVYGFAPLSAQGAWDFSKFGFPQGMGEPSDDADATTIAQFCGIDANDVVDVTEMSNDGASATEMPRHAIIVHHATKSIVIAIRGTASVTDGLVHDMVCHDEPFLWGVAHAGFANAATVLHRSLGPRLAKWRSRYPSYRVVITGHSLGGGVACLLSLLLFESSPTMETKTYAFAPPPSFKGDAMPRAAAAFVEDSIVSFVNPNDIVPHLSLERIFRTLQKLLALDAEPTPGYSRVAIIAGFSSPSEEMLEVVEGGGGDADACAFPALIIPGKIVVLPDMSVVDGATFARLDVPLGMDMIQDHLLDAYMSRLRQAANA